MFGATRHSSDASTCTPMPTSSGAAPERVGQRADQQLAEREPDQRAGERELDGGGGRAEVVGDRRQRRQVHVDGQRAERDQRTEDEHQPQPAPPGRWRDSSRAGSRVAVTKCLSGLYASGKYFPVQGLRNRSCSRREPSHGSRDRDGLPCGHARRADGAVHVHDLRRDVRAGRCAPARSTSGRASRTPTARASLLADAAANITGGRQPVPARARRRRRCAPRSPSTSGASTASTSTPTTC